ncbi:MAG: FAD-dependent oxidoreductase [Magnetococcales bacterium]|nr:FAD-dependent oxidoreductase [Magnetococcales bacterium]
MRPTVIIGTGLAGYTLAKELRRLQWQGPLVLVTEDEGQFYSKPMLSGALAKKKDVAALTMASAEKMAADLDAQILTQSQVTAIDTQEKQLTINGQKQPYDKLVLAIGSFPIRLPLTGSGAEEVVSVNNLTDYGHFLNRLEKAHHVAIIGPGLIGSEFANDLLLSGRQVTMIGPDKWPINTLIPEEIGRAVQKTLAEKGATWHLETFNGPIEKETKGYSTVLKSGVKVEADLILSAVGVRPTVELAKKAGVEVNRGIVTDSFLKTSVDSLYALGDCAEVAGRNLPFIAPLMIQAKALAKTLAGTETEVVYPAMPVVIKTTLYPVVTQPPPMGAQGAWRIDATDKGIIGRFYNKEDKLIGFALGGEATDQKAALTKELE